MTKTTLIIAILTTLVMINQSCKKDENVKIDKEKSTIFYNSFNPPLTVIIPTSIENNTIRFDFENDSILKSISFFFNKIVNYNCPNGFYDPVYYYYLIGIDFGENSMTIGEHYFPGSPFPIKADSIIDESYLFYNKPTLYFEADCNDLKYNCTEFDFMKSNYYGIKLSNGNLDYFGWIRFDFDERDTFKLVEYAYQTSTVNSIMAGQKE
ncbi:MAG: hypothetical protein WCX31_04095 [Salinivirgaceae bacterium]|jgi:hypothetical protein